MTVALPNAVKGLSEVISCQLFVTVLTTKYILNPHGTYRKPSKTTKLFTVGLLLNCERKHIQYNFQKTSPWNNSGRANSERWVPAAQTECQPTKGHRGRHRHGPPEDVAAGKSAPSFWMTIIWTPALLLRSSEAEPSAFPWTSCPGSVHLFFNPIPFLTTFERERHPFSLVKS